jgi:hypothetical protein
MKLTIRRPKELTGMLVSLDIYIDGHVGGRVASNSEIELCLPDQKVEVFVKTSWCESNRIMIESDAQLKTYAKGGLLGATFNSLFNPKGTYILEKEK